MALGALAYTPYQLLMASIVPTRAFGVSLMASVVPAALLVIASLSLRGQARTDAARVTLMFSVGLGVVILLKRVLALGPIHVVGLRFLLTIPLWLRVMKYVMAEERVRQVATRIICVNGIIAAAVGLLYAWRIITIRMVFGPDGTPIANDPLGLAATRASGFLANPNLYGAMLVALGLVAAFVVLPRSHTRGLLLIGAAAVGILVSGSRLSFVALALIVVSAFAVRPLRNARGTGLRYLTLIVLILTALPASWSIAGRLSATTIRTQKSAIGVHAIIQGTDTIIAGAREEALVPIPGSDKLAFSDNGWLQMAVSVGVPLTVALIVNSTAILWPRRRRSRPWQVRVVLAVAVTTMLLNNANLWDPWLSAIAAVYWIVAYVTVPIPAALSAASTAPVGRP